MTTKTPRGAGGRSQYRLDKMRRRSLQPPPPAGPQALTDTVEKNVSLDCGWGRLHFAQTFESMEELADALHSERPSQRDIALYVREPHVALAQAPHDLFLDPSHTYRLDLNTYRTSQRPPKGFSVRRLCTAADAEAVNRIYTARNMVQVDPQFFWSRRDSRTITVLVAEDEQSGEIIGTVTGIDHSRAFNDPEKGSSLWCLAVDPQSVHPGIGEALVRRLADHFQARGTNYLDLSVLHDNVQAIALYEKLGFRRVPFFAIKNKNLINEKLFAGPAFDAELNVYARIILDEARRRGIGIEILDAEAGYFRLTFGGRSITCREALSELTTAVAMSRCDDKAVTRRLLGAAGLVVPAQQRAASRAEDEAFLERYGAVVVKPAHGEQGRGIAVNLTDIDEVEAAIEIASRQDSHVLLEQYVEGMDLRVIVIGFKVVAAAVRLPPKIVGDGQHNVRELIERQSRRREAATNGESSIPIDAECERCVRGAGYGFDTVPPEGEQITVRGTANLHTGGTIHDVTDQLDPTVVRASVKAAQAIDIPVVGLDFIVPDPASAEYVIIEANERPGLANHEPQPTAERFIDLLFPQSMPTDVRQTRFGGQ